jgi:uncharacterized membrane protein
VIRFLLMIDMKPKEFIANLDEARIVAAIAAAERKTSGQICVYISRKKRLNPLAAAQIRFLRLGMHKTRQRNAVLLYFAPQQHRFAIWGDIGIHEKCGEAFWPELTAIMTPWLKKGELTQAIEDAIKKIGQVLAKHFPREPDDTNELPDTVRHD